MGEELRKASILLRNELGLLDLTQLESLDKFDKEMSEADYLNRANETELYYKNHYEAVLKLMILEQCKVIGVGAMIQGQKVEIDNEPKLLIARGFILGLLNNRDWFEKQRDIALGRFKQEDKEPTTGIKTVGEFRT